MKKGIQFTECLFNNRNNQVNTFSIDNTSVSQKYPYTILKSKNNSMTDAPPIKWSISPFRMMIKNDSLCFIRFFSNFLKDIKTKNI